MSDAEAGGVELTAGQTAELLTELGKQVLADKGFDTWKVEVEPVYAEDEPVDRDRGPVLFWVNVWGEDGKQRFLRNSTTGVRDVRTIISPRDYNYTGDVPRTYTSSGGHYWAQLPPHLAIPLDERLEWCLTKLIRLESEGRDEDA